MQVHPRVTAYLLALACCVPAAGCTLFGDRDLADSSGDTMRSTGDYSRQVATASYEEPLADAPEQASMKLEDFYPTNWGRTVKTLAGRGPNHDVARKLYGEGEELYREAVTIRQQNSDADVRDQFLQASDRFAAAAGRWPNSALEEDALFRAAESQFFADHYVQANDYFEQLLKKYPNTRYLDLVGARRFMIAQYWLDLDKSDSGTTLGFNLIDSARPWTDTFGHAVRILDRMRIDDPTGKLADDATIAAAGAMLASGDYLKADQYYSDLRTNFPNSEHQFMAHFLGIEAKLKGYKGPDYAGDDLDQAEKLIKQVRRQFPTESRKHQEALDRAYGMVRYRKAEREWTMAQYYRRRHEYGAARFYYEQILKRYADTPFAERTRQQIPEIADKPLTPPQKMAWLVHLFPDQEDTQPLIATSTTGATRR